MRVTAALPVIRALDDATILKIAAGEVVERPSCIVKELVENALDAGATRIEVSLQNGGIDEIAVRDDGHGIPRDQLTLAVAAHATSKLSAIDDLGRVSTMGFRGEALASIAAVADFSLTSKTAEQSEAYRIDVPFGATPTVRPDALETGTLLRVRSLFMNVPARKKFLKSAGAERQHIERTLRRIAMIQPSVAWKLAVDGAEVLDLPRAADARERVGQIYGRDVARQLIPVRFRGENATLEGYVSGKDLHFGRPQEIWLSVNRRPVQDRSLQHAVLEGYRSALMERRYPFALLDVAVSPAEVDVNIHPRKSEVRFARGQNLFGLVAKAIERAIDRPAAREMLRTDGASLASSAGVLRAAPAAIPAGLFDAPPPEPWSAAETFAGYAASPVSAPQAGAVPGFFASLRFLSHLDHTYWILKGDDTLYLVDQHAAHERVLFERLKSADRGLSAQTLLVPATLELTADQEGALRAIAADLDRSGFILEPFGARTYLVRGVPEFAGRRDPALLVRDLVDDALENEAGRSARDVHDHFVATLACHAAVRAHDALTDAEIRALLVQMDETRLSSYCPHGRPTYLEFPLAKLEKLFQRA